MSMAKTGSRLRGGAPRLRIDLLDPRELWTERFGRHIGRAEMWRQTSALAGIAALIGAVVIAFAVLAPRVEPVAVLMDRTGTHAVVGRVAAVPADSATVVVPILKRFVADLSSTQSRQADGEPPLGLGFVRPGSPAEAKVLAERAKGVVGLAGSVGGTAITFGSVTRELDAWRVQWVAQEPGDTVPVPHALLIRVDYRPAIGLAPIDPRNPLGLYIEDLTLVAPRKDVRSPEPPPGSMQ